MDHETIEVACIALGALALLMQSIVLVAIYLGVRKSSQSLKEEIEDIRSSVMPVVHTTRKLVDRVGPKVEQTATDLAVVAQSLRIQALELEGAVAEIVERVRKETGRIDAMFSSTLDAVDKASVYVTQTVSKPVRQLSGILASFKAIIESLRSTDPSFREPVIHDDKDMFV
jgi:ABC-type transporter Mla subunit MlaD